jgi:predicted nucleic acid-binding protein
MIALLDNTVLSNFTAVGRPDLVRLALGEDAATSEAAWAELQAGIHIGRLPAQDWSWLPILPLTETEKPLYNLFAECLNAGEAACLAILRLIDLRILSLAEGDTLLARMIAAGYRSPVTSLQELL